MTPKTRLQPGGMRLWSLFGTLVIGTNAAVGADVFKPLFDGETLGGWQTRGGAEWEVQDGVIVGRSGSGGVGWLCTQAEFGDFVLELEVKADSGNSGIQVRSHIDEKDIMTGYQFEVDTSQRAWSGGLYDQGRRNWLQTLEENEAARNAFKVGEWNRYRIRCVGDSLRCWVNGVPAADYRDSMDLKGIIALQVHSGQDVEVRFRNLRLKPMGRHEWQPIWDGKTFDGWHRIGKGNWEIKEGVIYGAHSKAEDEFGHLVTDAEYEDFTVRVEYKALAGNSGFYFRIAESGFSGVTGFQAEIDPNQDAGGLYETNGRAWVVKPEPEQVKEWYRPDEWNTMTVSAHGRRVVVHVNGYHTAELKDDPGRLKGHLALQLHGGQDVEVQFRKIERLQQVDH